MEALVSQVEALGYLNISLAVVAVGCLLQRHKILYYLKIAIVAVWLGLTCFLGILVGILWIPFPSKRNDLNYYCGTLFLKVSYLLGITHTIEGLENLPPQPCIYVLNHQSFLDMLSMAAIMPKNTLVIGKKSLLFVPILGMYIKLARNILIDRGNRAKAIEALDGVVQEISRRKVGVIIFPEGSRSQTGTFLPFKKGAFNMAIQGQIPLSPIVISNQTKVYDAKEKTFTPGNLKIKILPPVQTKGKTKDDVNELTEHVQQLMQKTFDELDKDTPVVEKSEKKKKKN